MSNQKVIFVCSECGAKSPKWQGKCSGCGEWNTLLEQNVAITGKSSKAWAGKPVSPIALSAVTTRQESRLQTGLAEFDEVMGGGIVPGSLILLGGDPGIGKSTLALQLANQLIKAGRRVLYVSGEESLHQIKLRNNRLSSHADLNVLTETDLESTAMTIVENRPEVVVIDSVQTMNSGNVNGVAGGVAQLSYATNLLMRLAKEHNIAMLIIGHVTKEGMLAGPKTIEHMVDVVLYLEGERFGNLRLLRSSKNRFGSVGEVGVFEMHESGLEEIRDIAGMFLAERSVNLPGSCVTVVLEGNKALLVEVQALTNTSAFGYPKRTTSGFDANRLQLIIAILQKVLKVNLGNQDVYVNVAGGLKAEERAMDLPVALAILSSYFGDALPEQLVAFGEIGLLGEIRPVNQAEKRLREAGKLGFHQVITANRQRQKPEKSIEAIKSVTELLQYFKSSKKKPPR